MKRFIRSYNAACSYSAALSALLRLSRALKTPFAPSTESAIDRAADSEIGSAFARVIIRVSFLSSLGNLAPSPWFVYAIARFDDESPKGDA